MLTEEKIINGEALGSTATVAYRVDKIQDFGVIYRTLLKTSWKTDLMKTAGN